MEGMKELEHAPTRGERRQARRAKPDVRRKPLRARAEESRTRGPRHGAWQTCECGKVASESLEAARHRHAVMQDRRGDTGEVEFYSCRAGSWHWTRVKTLTTCPGGGRGYEQLTEAVGAAEAAMVRPHPSTVKAVTYACFDGCFHWAWFPSWLRFTKCRCGQPAYPSATEAAFMTAFCASREPGARSDPYQCSHGSWHLGRRRAPLWSATLPVTGAVTPLQAPAMPAALRPVR